LPLLAAPRLGREGAPSLARDAPHDVAVPSSSNAWVWLILLGMCVAQYWTVLVTELGLHFHLATVLLFSAQAAILVVLLRADVREGRLPFVARFFAVPARGEPSAERSLTQS
jgi:hypothetical protein